MLPIFLKRNVENYSHTDNKAAALDLFVHVSSYVYKEAFSEESSRAGKSFMPLDHGKEENGCPKRRGRLARTSC